MSRPLPDIHWSELVCADPAKAADFYRNVVGWSVQEMDMGGPSPYRVCMNGETAVCGIMERPAEMGDGPDMWTTYIGVADVDAAVEKVKANGGAVLGEPFDIPDVGRIAMIRDSVGAAVGIITPSAS